MPVHTDNCIHFDFLPASKLASKKWLSDEKHLYEEIMDTENDVVPIELRYRKRDLKPRAGGSKENGKQDHYKEKRTHDNDEENRPRKKILNVCLKKLAHDTTQDFIANVNSVKKRVGLQKARVKEKERDYEDVKKFKFPSSKFDIKNDKGMNSFDKGNEEANLLDNTYEYNTFDTKNKGINFDMIKHDKKMSESETKQENCKNYKRFYKEKRTRSLGSLSKSRSAKKKLNMWVGRLRTSETVNKSNESQLNHLQQILDENRSKLTLPKLFQALKWSVVRSKGDGHCLLYSVVSGWSNQMLISPKPRQLTYDSLLRLVSHEAQSNSHLYENFLTESYTK